MKATTEFKGITAVMLAFTLSICGLIFYDIYTRPADPQPAGTVLIEIGGTDGVRFQGDVGTLRESHNIEAVTPVTLETPYRHADWIVADISKVADPTNRGTLRVKIQKYERAPNERKPHKVTLEEGETSRYGGKLTVMWKAPEHQTGG